MTVRMIWAEARGGVIGAAGGIPWRIPGEQAMFKQRTMGSTVVMGRPTWESLPDRVRPLPGRRNVVLTRRPGWAATGAEAASSVPQVLAAHDDLWVIGGEVVYAAFLPYATHVVRTEIDLAVDGDAYAPALGEEWSAAPDAWQTSDTGVRFRVVEHIRVPR
ncbi:dihydrofolate reductase [Mangrovihabitans endophyticus]|uniref:Dihydrofolate reductase n=1 Tax=Mangrovihabitans endophyticus TaxID=1751298 RepID=A0A8J3FNA2_9ACTN|nr:dihydrofolate reductase [Mangrovihabitans endophyticus]GGK90489.1 dihydrofolate reductase [Mangrovihabitans endophyticus]